MKRIGFLSAAGAAVLAGCGGHHGLSPLPAAKGGGSTPAVPSGAMRLVPQTADAIPTRVLANPIIGEARRFDGASAPNGWTFARGQQVSVAENAQLFSVLGGAAAKPAGGTFTLPNSKVPTIIAMNGQLMTSPQMLAQYRPMDPRASLGPGANLPPAKPPKPIPAPVAEARALVTSAVRASDAPAQAVSAELKSRIASAKDDASASALQALSEANRARLQSAFAAAASGSVSLDDAVHRVASSLSWSEAAGVLKANDVFVGRFNDRWSGTPGGNAALDAANALFALVPSRDQVRAIADAQDR